jgi:hypothetical protein
MALFSGYALICITGERAVLAPEMDPRTISLIVGLA